MRRWAKVKDIIGRVAELKWRRAGHVARQDPNNYRYRKIVASINKTKRRKTQNEKWFDTLTQIAKRNWHQSVLDRDIWKSLEEVYMQ